MSDAFPTVAWRIRDWAERTPDRVAIREKDFGIWQEMTSSELWDHVLTAAHAMLAFGIEPGQVTSIHSEDRPEWLIFDFASVAIRAICTGLYPTNPMAEVQYLLGDAASILHFAEDQEQVDKVVDAPADAFPTIKKIIYVEPRGIRVMTDSRLMFWDDFMEIGREHREANPGAVERLMADVDPDEVVTLIYTSGTTGPPKGSMLTHRNVEFGVEKVLNSPDRFQGGRGEGVDDEKLTYLPLCHVAERLFSAWSLAYNGPILNFAESIETVQADLREVQPTIFFAVPRIWERIHAGIHIKLQDGTRFKRLISAFGLKLGVYIGRSRVANNGNFTLGSRIAYWIGYPLFFRSLRERIGLRHCRYASSGAAAIAPEVLQFFMGLGIRVYELYGMTENTAVATSNFDGRVKLGTVGEPYDGIGLRIDEETGEIQTKHAANFVGYWNRPEATVDTFTEDGWLKTGDVGVWVDGTHVKIVDRIKDIIITSGGKNISPSEIENSLKASPYIKVVMVIGDGRKYLTAMIGIEYDVVGDWALRRKIPYTTYRDLGEKPEVLKLIQGVVNATNEKFAHIEQIKKFSMIPKELDHEDGELTATQKVKRSAMTEMFGDLVESMYS
ncbi:MAG: AMP-binding protein [Actinomycetota bacterium]|nr:AMP-binding protein [Actinomycetota bacterium]MDK1016629.1 AMP-binding protein [Actinomycetota bacterium]MDK1027007.1 AMP-binding protein [Actinomycetota bacterium]MDK1038481.1 AMP-binding protein [Actinomycetota bacterium]MDK1096327.1 AMP-binding protein [Actinomycetota bacterium]